MSETVNKAIKIATEAHQHQTRKYNVNGCPSPYIFHPMEVARKAWKLGFGDLTTLASSILHDVIEDNFADEVYYTKLIREIDDGEEIISVVRDLTLHPLENKKDYLEKFNSKNINPRSLVVKLCDRICNVKDFYFADPKYSWKYFEKAKPLEKALELNKKRIIEMFGEKAEYCLRKEWEKLKNKVSQYS